MKRHPHSIGSFRGVFRRKRDWLLAKIGDRVVGGPLFGFFFAATPRGRKSSLANLGANLEALAVIRTLLVEQELRRRHSVLALGELLQQRFIVATRFARGG